jgi:hypothetical protein
VRRSFSGAALLCTTAIAGRAAAVTGPELPQTAAEASVVGLGTTPLACGAPFFVQCSGVVVGPRSVLTAAHCVEAGLHTGHFQVLAKGSSDEAYEAFEIESTRVHDAYVRGQADNDLAVVTTARPLPAPAAAWAPVAIDPGSTAQIWGFGATRAGEATEARARGGSVTISTASARTLRFSPAPNMLCDGDSGGGLFVSTPNGRELVGILSQGDSACDAWGLAARVDDAFVTRSLASASSAAAPREAASYDRLCSSPCATETDCPTGTRCLPIGSGQSRCVIDGMPPGDLVGTCTNANCDSCVQVSGAGGCSCFRECEAPPPPVSNGCSSTGRFRPTNVSGLAALAFVALTSLLARSQHLRRHRIRATSRRRVRR